MEEVRSFMRAVYEWRENARGVTQQASRTRFLFLCLLIRYGGMRLSEALAFNDNEDFDESTGILTVHGRWSRSVPLPPKAMRKLLELRDSPYVLRERGRLCCFDQGYTRRVFENRSAEAALGKHFSPSRLRRYREEELLRYGISPELVKKFLGKESRGGLTEIEQGHVRHLLRLNEDLQRYGRHNFFKGIITHIEFDDFTVRVEVLMNSGDYTLRMQCTRRSSARFELREGKEISLSVQSLHVRLSSSCEVEDGMNILKAKVQEVLIGDNQLKVLLELSNGDRLSAILDRREREKLYPSVGDELYAIIPENLLSLKA